MRIGSIVLFGLYASMTVAAQQASPVCERIQQWDARISAQQAEIARLLQRYTEKHPEIMIQRKTLASLEASRAADVNQASAQGVSCTPIAQREAPAQSGEKADGAKSKQ